MLNQESIGLTAQRQGFFSDERKREYQPMFEVAAGEHVKNMPVRLMPAAVVSGEVLDEYNDPVQDVEIRLLVIQMKLGQMYLRIAGKAITDDRGQYRVAGLHPGPLLHGGGISDRERNHGVNPNSHGEAIGESNQR